MSDDLETCKTCGDTGAIWECGAYTMDGAEPVFVGWCPTCNPFGNSTVEAVGETGEEEAELPF